MKNNYNPYTVPADYFENASKQAMTRLRNRSRALRYGIAGMVVAAAFIITPLFIRSYESNMQEKEVASNNLACMYEYDVFLQINFTK